MMAFVTPGKLRRMVRQEVEAIRAQVIEQLNCELKSSRPETCPGCGCNGVQVRFGCMNYTCGTAFGDLGLNQSLRCKARADEVYNAMKGIS